jgi:tagaturonate epimerase
MKPSFTHVFLKSYFPGIFEKSIHRINETTLFMVHDKQKDVLIVIGDLLDFEGEKQNKDNFKYYEIELSSHTAHRLRSLFSFTKPIRVLRKPRSFGLGDRLGIAGEGHLKVFENVDAYPVLAQQSMRELHMTKRTYQDVLDQATFAVFKMGYKDGFGADGDHLKTIPDIKNALDLGYTMITLDCSDYIKTFDDSINTFELPDIIKKSFLNRIFFVGQHKVVFSLNQLRKAYYVYQEALHYTKKVYDTFFNNKTYDADFELSIDETHIPTTPEDHVFVAHQLSLMGVKIDTLAPRFCGEFQKGIDYIGSVEDFEKELKIHADIAKTYGYKLSIHSGSDKFSIFKSIGVLTKGQFHVKTAGTNWLEAMRLIATVEPKLYREIHAFALDSFEQANKLYHVTTNLNNIPKIDTLKDEELPLLFDHNDARQLIHITYGYILNAEDKDGFRFKNKLYKLWHEHHSLYAEMLEKHIGKHLKFLYEGIKKKEMNL